MGSWPRAGAGKAKSLFGKNGTIPFGEHFYYKKSVLSVLKRKEKGYLWERNGTVVSKQALNKTLPPQAGEWAGTGNGDGAGARVFRGAGGPVVNTRYHSSGCIYLIYSLGTHNMNSSQHLTFVNFIFPSHLSRLLFFFAYSLMMSMMNSRVHDTLLRVKDTITILLVAVSLILKS